MRELCDPLGVTPEADEIEMVGYLIVSYCILIY
jgi:hypothetical protein